MATQVAFTPSGLEGRVFGLIPERLCAVTPTWDLQVLHHVRDARVLCQMPHAQIENSATTLASPNFSAALSLGPALVSDINWALGSATAPLAVTSLRASSKALATNSLAAKRTRQATADVSPAVFSPGPRIDSHQSLAPPRVLIQA